MSNIIIENEVAGKRSCAKIIPLCMEVGILSPDDIARKIFGDADVGKDAKIDEVLDAYRAQFEKLNRFLRIG